MHSSGGDYREGETAVDIQCFFLVFFSVSFWWLTVAICCFMKPLACSLDKGSFFILFIYTPMQDG